MLGLDYEPPRRGPLAGFINFLRLWRSEAEGVTEGGAGVEVGQGGF